jgi:AcrR family transcriptional regulator
MARPKSDISTRIIDAARARFSSDGVEGASLRRIAQDAGTNIGMVYYYFKTKDELFLSVVEDVYGVLLGDLRAALAAHDVPPEQRLLRIFERAARFSDRELEVVRLIMREALVSSERLARLASRFEHGHMPLVFDVLTEGVQSGRIARELHPAVLAAATFSLAMLPQLLHHLVTQAGLPFAALLPSRPDAAAALGKVLLRGISGPQLPRE